MKDNIMLDEQEEQEEEYQGMVIYGWKLYTLIAVILIVLSTVSYNAYTASSEAQKVNTSNEQLKASTGAKIDALMKKRAENRANWSKEQKQIEASTVNQEKLNASTTKIEEELAKLNISVIN